MLTREAGNKKPDTAVSRSSRSRKTGFFPFCVGGGLAILLAVSVPSPLGAAPAAGASAEGPAASSHDDFQTWLEGFQQTASRAGIGSATLASALSDLAPDPRVIRLDRKQPEFTWTFAEYLGRTATPARIRTARRLARAHAETFRLARERYGVQKRFLLALWAVETDFGRNTGDFDMIRSLATLAWDGRRSAYFSRELMDALRVIDRGRLEPRGVKGSWAGALGHFQFMPSVVKRFWVDTDDNNRVDLWGDPDEAILSAARYLAKMGWKGDQTWGREVRLPDNFDRSLAGRKKKRPLRTWQRLGLRRTDGRNLPRRNLPAALVMPDTEGPAFLVYENYRLIRSWNQSDLFALSVGILSDRIDGR